MRTIRPVILLVSMLLAPACMTTEATVAEIAYARKCARVFAEANQRVITVCFDGTANVPATGTNVYRLHTLFKYDLGTASVIPYYTEGVGTRGPKAKKGKIHGFGLIPKVADAYLFLCEVWRPGDTIVLVGFSRGAYAARLLAGLIDTFGIHTSGRTTPFDETQHGPLVGAVASLCEAFTKAESREEARQLVSNVWPATHGLSEGEWVAAVVDCLVCFDTVAKVDEAPKEWLQLADPLPPDLQLEAFASTRVVLHALALDEKRDKFVLVPFRAPEGETRLEQFWFAGSHSDIGGGYGPNDAALVALRWVVSAMPETVKLQLGLPTTTKDGKVSVIYPLNDEMKGLSIWDLLGEQLRSRVPGSIVHPSVRDRMAAAERYKPTPEWWDAMSAGQNPSDKLEAVQTSDRRP